MIQDTLDILKAKSNNKQEITILSHLLRLLTPVISKKKYKKRTGVIPVKRAELSQAI